MRLGARFRLLGPAHVAEVAWREAPLHLAKLVTFMNVSGPPLARLLRLLDATPNSWWSCTTTWTCRSGRCVAPPGPPWGASTGWSRSWAPWAPRRCGASRSGWGDPRRGDEVVDWVLTPFSDEGAALPGVIERAADAALQLAGGDPA